MEVALTTPPSSQSSEKSEDSNAGEQASFANSELSLCALLNGAPRVTRNRRKRSVRLANRSSSNLTTNGFSKKEASDVCVSDSTTQYEESLSKKRTREERLSKTRTGEQEEILSNTRTEEDSLSKTRTGESLSKITAKEEEEEKLTKTRTEEDSLSTRTEGESLSKITAKEEEEEKLTKTRTEEEESSSSPETEDQKLKKCNSKNPTEDAVSKVTLETSSSEHAPERDINSTLNLHGGDVNNKIAEKYSNVECKKSLDLINTCTDKSEINECSDSSQDNLSKSQETSSMGEDNSQESFDSCVLDLPPSNRNSIEASGLTESDDSWKSFEPVELPPAQNATASHSQNEPKCVPSSSNVANLVNSKKRDSPQASTKNKLGVKCQPTNVMSPIEEYFAGVQLPVRNMHHGNSKNKRQSSDLNEQVCEPSVEQKGEQEKSSAKRTRKEALCVIEDQFESMVEVSPSSPTDEENYISHLCHKLSQRTRKLMCEDCNTLICPVCHYNVDKSVQRHFTTGTEEALCSVCHIKFVSPCALKAHEHLHTGRPPFICPSCGSSYRLKKFFRQHSMGKCSHLYLTPQYMCRLCSTPKKTVLLNGWGAFNKHQNMRHLLPGFRCKFCETLLLTSEEDALNHAKTEHGANVKGWSIGQCGLKSTNFCEYCNKEVLSDHMNAFHRQKPKRTVYRCMCRKTFDSQATFRRHRGKCTRCKAIPPNWTNLLTDYADDARKMWVDCSVCLDSFERDANDSRHACPSCHNLRWMDKKCMSCGDNFYGWKEDAHCSQCREMLRSETTSEWIGREQVIGSSGEKRENVFDICDIIYDDQSEDHQYCRRRDLVSNIIPEWHQQSTAYRAPFFKLKMNERYNEAVDDYLGVKKPDSTDVAMNKTCQKDGIICCVCQTVIPDNENNKLKSYIVHLKLLHYNAVIPFKISAAMIQKSSATARPLANIQAVEEDVPVLVRLNAIKKERMIIKEATPDVVAAKPVERRTSKGVPVEIKSPEEIVKPVETKKPHKKKIVPIQAADTSKKRGSVDNDTSSTEKEHEFWDKISVALVTAEKLKIPGAPLTTSKRQVKRPKRYASEDDDESDEHEETTSNPSPGKTKSNALPPSEYTPKASKPLIVIKPSEIEDNSGSTLALNKKSKKKENYYDADIEKIKNELKRDDEIGFIAKTFDTSAQQAFPNKRKLKPSSKLRYNQLITKPETHAESSYALPKKLTCSVCNVKFETRDEFVTHVRTHRKSEYTFQCMECGECFVVRQTLVTHLHFYHKIKDADVYILENGCSDQINPSSKSSSSAVEVFEPKPNQCKVCRVICPSPADLNKHFRIHGAAFLKEAKSVKA